MTHPAQAERGTPQVRETLNTLINQFWTGLIQHRTHVIALRTLGLTKLAGEMEQRISDEPETIESLSVRLIDLGGYPKLDIATPATARTLSEILTLDLQVQTAGLARLNEAAKAVAAYPDVYTRKLIEDIIADEEEHWAWLSNENALLAQLGEPLYISRWI